MVNADIDPGWPLDLSIPKNKSLCNSQTNLGKSTDL